MCEGIILVYSITSRSSFEEISVFYHNILRMRGVAHCPMILNGNKCDLESERQVSTGEGKDLALSYGCKFFETSAKTGVNIDESFFQMVREIREHRGGQPISLRGGRQVRVCTLL